MVGVTQLRFKRPHYPRCHPREPKEGEAKVGLHRKERCQYLWVPAFAGTTATA